MKVFHTLITFIFLIIIPISFAAFERNAVWNDEAQLWDDVVRKSFNKARGYNNLGISYNKKGQHDRAIEDYNKAIAIDPNYAHAYYNRGTVYGRDKVQYDRAIEDFNKAIQLDPNFAQAYYNRGFAYFLSGNRGRAISDLQKACDLGDDVGCEYLQKFFRDM